MKDFLSGASAVLLGVLIVAWLNGPDLGARSLTKPQREIVVRQVSNGYVVQLKDVNNPYAAIEQVAKTHEEAAQAVAVLLKSSFPKPRWGN